MHCHSTQQPAQPAQAANGHGPIILVGNPNVGKSVIFGALTKRYVEVSNYPGTTVEITRGSLSTPQHPALNGVTLIDTPGINSLIPRSDDERVTRDILLRESPRAVIQVADAKNLRRALILATQLAELEVPFLLDLNMADEAAARGLHINLERLTQILGVAVVATVAPKREGIDQLLAALDSPSSSPHLVRYDAPIEAAINQIAAELPEKRGKRGLALMWLAGDDSLAERWRPDIGEEGIRRLEAIRHEVARRYAEPLGYILNQQRLRCADCILEEVYQTGKSAWSRRDWGERLGRWAIHPIVGWPILIAVLLLTYLFVGDFGAGTLVDFVEGTVFGEWIIPLVSRLVSSIPVPFIQDLLVGEYGLVTIGLSYGFGIVMPIVTTFFILFSLLEDSGYLPRLAVMVNRPMKAMGLNGKAVLPMVLGLGCDTMATLTTRIMETRKERLQVTLLLALGVPCSAQLGVILGMVALLNPVAAVIWGAVVLATLFAVGYLAARLLPGESSDFILELPPIRRPQLSNIIVKTLARLEWYLREVIPLFLLGTLILFTLDKTGALALIERLAAPLIVGALGLPQEAAGAFLIGFLRRDYGAAGLFQLARAGQLDSVQILVSMVVITLFIPCIANLLMIVKEYGRRVAAGMAAFVFPFAFLVGSLLNLALRTLGVRF